MNNLMRMCYGRSGNRLARVLVSAPCRESAPDPRWLKVLEVLFWILIPALVIRFAVPPTPRQMTVIDASRLMEKPSVPLEKTVIAESKPLPKVETLAPQDRPQVETAQKPLDHPRASQREEVRPSLVRPSGARDAETLEYTPRIARERVRPEEGIGTPLATHIGRKTAVNAAPAGGVTITRTRGAVAVDVPVAAGYRVAALRRAPATGNVASGGATGGVVLRPGANLGRSSGGVATAGGSGPIVVASRERTSATGSGGGEGSSAVGLVRGVSLMNLEICSSPQEEEDHVRAVLGVVGSRRSCVSDKGEFQFKGTTRVSSFNLMIFPSKGRRPSNRCEELEYAYRCLTTH